MAENIPSEQQEAKRLVEMFEGNRAATVTFLSGQFAVLKNQAQILLGLCSVTITVTGFSGQHMVRGGPASTGAMVLGIGLILIAAVLTLRTISTLRWVSQDLTDDLIETASRVIQRRNRQQRALSWAGGFVALGLGGYLVAVVLAALHAGSPAA